MDKVTLQIEIQGNQLVVTANGETVRLPNTGNRVEHLARAHLGDLALEMFNRVVEQFGGCEGVRLREGQRDEGVERKPHISGNGVVISRSGWPSVWVKDDGSTETITEIACLK